MATNEIEIQTFCLFVGDTLDPKKIDIRDLEREFQFWKQDIEHENNPTKHNKNKKAF